jgi:hypothetical protein
MQLGDGFLLQFSDIHEALRMEFWCYALGSGKAVFCRGLRVWASGR